jgi:hypothetical protein
MGLQAVAIVSAGDALTVSIAAALAGACAFAGES